MNVILGNLYLVMCLTFLLTCHSHKGFPENKEEVEIDLQDMYSYDMEDSDFDALYTLKHSVKRRSFRDYKEFACRGWNSNCAPWTNKPELGCCYSRGLSCKCNLWMHNCRCVTRLWGK